jgi:hypothetical protein
MTTSNANDPTFEVPSAPSTEMSTDVPEYVTDDGSPASPETGHETGGGSDGTGPGPTGS